MLNNYVRLLTYPFNDVGEAYDYLEDNNDNGYSLDEEATQNQALVDELGYYIGGGTSTAGGKDAWSLTQITLPTGGHIQINYEQDDCDIDALRYSNQNLSWDEFHTGEQFAAFRHPIVEEANYFAKQMSINQHAYDLTQLGFGSPQEWQKLRYKTFEMDMTSQSGGIRVASLKIHDGMRNDDDQQTISYSYETGQFTTVPASYWRNYLNAFSGFQLSEHHYHQQEIGNYADASLNDKKVTAYQLAMGRFGIYHAVDNTVTDQTHYYPSILETSSTGSRLKKIYGAIDPPDYPNQQLILPARYYLHDDDDQNNTELNDDTNPLGFKLILAENKDPGNEIVLKETESAIIQFPTVFTSSDYDLEITNKGDASFYPFSEEGSRPIDNEKPALMLWGYTEDDKITPFLPCAEEETCSDSENCYRYYCQDFGLFVEDNSVRRYYSVAVKSMTETTINHGVTTTTALEFDEANHYQLNKQTVNHADGNTYITENAYTTDYTPTSGMNASNNAIVKLQSQNIHVPIETVTHKNGQIIGGQINTFDLFDVNGRQLALPFETWALEIKEPISTANFTYSTIGGSQVSGLNWAEDYERKATILAYDDYSNVIHTQKIDDVATYIFWDDTHTVPISKITNPEMPDTDDPNPDEVYCGKYSLGTFYEYHPTFRQPTRVTTIVDNTKRIASNTLQVTAEDGMSAYMEYNAFGQIVMTRDDDHQARKQTIYHYKNDPQMPRDVGDYHRNHITVIQAAESHTQHHPYTPYSDEALLNEGIKNVTYLDGLGRAIQQTAVDQSPEGLSIIQPIRYSYSGYNSGSKQYLPYTSENKSLHWCNSEEDQICDEQRDFYEHTMGYEEDYEYAFAETEWQSYGGGPLVQQISAAPGYDWRKSSLIRVVESRQASNEAGEVRKWNVDGISTDAYPEKTLYRQITNDENKKQEVHIFKNGAGQTILSRVKKAQSNNNEVTDTYYIYDDFGNLIYVAPPLATQQLKASGSGTWNVRFVDNLMYAYTYDKRQRVTHKKIPNKGIESFVYDRLDRVVLSRDSLLRTQQKWLFTKYDVLSRPVLTGTYHSGSVFDDIIATDISDNNLFESRINDATNHDYTNDAFPTDDIAILTVNYYDDYEYEGADKDGSVGFWSSWEQYTQAEPNFKGKLTGVKTKVLHYTSLSDLNEWVITSYHYNEDGKLFLEKGDSHLSTKKVFRKSSYNQFSGLLLYQATRISTPNEVSINAGKWYEYNQRNRQLKAFTASTGHTSWEMLNNYHHKKTARYHYDELGRLSQKLLHISKDIVLQGSGVGLESDTLQVVDYTYNIRGWLTGINATDATRVGVANSTIGGAPPIKYCWEDQLVSLLTIAKKLDLAQDQLSLSDETTLPFLTYLYDRRLADKPDLNTSVHLDVTDQIEAQKVVHRLATTGRFTTTVAIAQPIYPLGEVIQLSHTIATTAVDDYEPFTGISESEVLPTGGQDDGTNIGTGHPNTGGIGHWDNPQSELAPLFTPLQQLSIPDRTLAAQGYQVLSTELVQVGLDLCAEEEEGGTTVQTPPIKPCWTQQYISLLDVYESMDQAETAWSLSPQVTKATVTYLHQRLPDPLPTTPNSVPIRTDRVLLSNQLIQVLAEEGRTATQEEITRPSYSVEAVAALTHTIATTPIGDPTTPITPPAVEEEIIQQASELVATLQELTTVDQTATRQAYQMLTHDVIALGEQLCGPQPQQFSSNPNEDDLFALALHYQKDFGESTAERQYNGNITAMDWQVYAPGATTAPLRRYVFDYDAQNRLTKANYFEHFKSNVGGADSEWRNNLTNYSVNDIQYDLNGNITYLERMGLTGTNHYDEIDQLTYTYQGNQLTAVEDNVPLNGVGFEDNPPLPNGGKSIDYEYDGNGNLTRDKNRKIYIAYDYRINLPVAISRYEGDGDNPAIIESLHFIYDAHGNKLAQCKHDLSTGRQSNGQPLLRLQDLQAMVATGDGDDWANLLRSMPVTNRRDYIAGIEYADGEAEAFYHEEGRIILSYDNGVREDADNNAAYEYTLSDHLGNGRIYFGDKNNDGKAEILQENHYYPFGMQMDGIGSTPYFPENNHQYNGIEELSDFDLDVYHATYRTLDPAIGRWWQVDPEAESFYGMSPYNSMANNPVSFVDPEGDFVFNLISKIVAGDINNVGDVFESLFIGTLTDAFTLGKFATPGFFGSFKSATTLLSVGAGFFNNPTTGNDSRFLENAVELFLGNFYTDANRSTLGQLAQVTARHNWETLQTEIGYNYSQLRNIAGRIDRVDYLGGVTFSTGENRNFSNGVSIGNFININIKNEITGSFEDRVTSDDLYMHEYGHTFQSQIWGPGYLFGIGLPSLISAATSKPIAGGLTTHRVRWYERQANRFAARYFGRHYGVPWNDSDFPR